MEKFQQWYLNRHEYAKEWKKRTGGKVVGYLCTYVPEEMLLAANILPVRILGSHEAPTAAEPYMYTGISCPFSRDCLSQGIRGKYDYLDGIMISQCCFQTRAVYWLWEKYVGVDFCHYIMMPQAVQKGKGVHKYLRTELNAFKEALERWLSINITDADLDRGIEIMNTSRQLMREVWDFRKMENPPLTGVDALDIVLSNQVMDKQEHSQALRELLKELPNRKLDRETGTRLMIVGSEDDDRDFWEMVEEKMTLPATIVIEDHCSGSRYFWNDVIPQEDRLQAIADRYINRVPCPSLDWPERKRFDQILDLAKEWNVEGVITMQQKFCEPHEVDIPDLRIFLEKNGYPSYFLEFDVTVPAGQFQTRVEAFLETMIELV